jgi:hypothetical protein
VVLRRYKTTSHSTKETEKMVDQMEKRGVGRPRTRPEKPRAGDYVGFRVPSELKAQLENEAKRNGRSLSTETQSRLEQAFKNETTLLFEAWGMAYGAQGRDFLRLIGDVIRHAPIGPDWLNDPAEYALVAAELTEIINNSTLRPQGPADQAAATVFGRSRARSTLQRAFAPMSPVRRGFDEHAAARVADWLESESRARDSEETIQ